MSITFSKIFLQIFDPFILATKRVKDSKKSGYHRIRKQIIQLVLPIL